MSEPKALTCLEKKNQTGRDMRRLANNLRCEDFRKPKIEHALAEMAEAIAVLLEGGSFD